ncbi:hypothetical protein [Arcicella rigui]|uniref:Uncharacterized protein n=1 Tax=Arcicella rigui TaxID=797020 RepID=A0ABU5QG26_9BACT|nr:hypothetical protein [Arcicella rigui]MEA5141806.1 hypothetical protein [Arcicella rigui]
MEKNKIIELQNKIVEGLNTSAFRLIESKKKNNGKMVVFNNGEIKEISVK